MKRKRSGLLGAACLTLMMWAQPAAAAVSARQGFSPFGIALTQDGRYAYLSFDLSPFVFKVRLSDMTVAASADLSRYFPLQCSTIALDATESKVFLLDHTLGRLLVLDAATLQEIKLIDGFGAGTSGQLVRSRWGPRLILASGRVWLIDTDTLAVTPINSSRGFTFVRESATDPALWFGVAPLPGSTEVGVYNYQTAQWSLKATITQPSGDWGVHDFAVLPDGSKAYLAVVGPWYPDYHASGWVYAIDLATGAVLQVSSDGGAKALAVSADGGKIYAGVGWPIPNTNLIQVLDTSTNTVSSVFQIAKQKFNWPCTQINELKLDPVSGQWLYATTSDGNAFLKLDAKTGATAAVLVLNDESSPPSSVVFQPGSSRAYVLLSSSTEALELDLNRGYATGAVRFPVTRTSFGAVFRDADTVLVAQGEYFVETSATLQMRTRHNLPNGAPALWNTVASRDSRTIYSCSQERGSTSGYYSDTLVAVDSTTFDVKASLKLEGGNFNLPWEHPTTGRLYVLGGLQNGAVRVHVVNTASLTLRKTITFDDSSAAGISAGPYYPYAYDAASRTLFVGTTWAILAIDTDTDEIKRVIRIKDITDNMGISQYSMTILNAVGLVYHPGQNRLYIAHLDGSFVSMYDLTANAFLPQLISLKGYFPGWMAASGDLSRIITLNRRSDSISVIDTAAGTVERVIDIHACNPSPARLEFTAGSGASGRVTLSALSTTGACTVSTSASWLSATPDGAAASAYTIAIDPSVFGSGVYRGTVTFRSAGLAESFLDVSLAVGWGISSVQIDGVVDAAGFAPAIAPGGWASIFGSGLAPATRSWRTDEIVDGVLPSHVEGTAVTVNGRSAPVHFVSPAQVNFQVPGGLADGAVAVQVSNNGALSTTFSTILRQRTPELFRYLPSEVVVALHICENAVLCPLSQAVPGETIVLYGSGFGSTTPAAPVGIVISAAYPVAATVEVRFGSTAVTAPAWLVGAGLYQINVKVPDSLAGGDIPLSISVGGVASTARAFLPVKSGR